MREMCYWQRWPHSVAIALAALAFTQAAGSQQSRKLTLLAAIALPFRGHRHHAGVELGIFEGLTCTSTASGATTADLLRKS
jgi:hypothetical protein